MILLQFRKVHVNRTRNHFQVVECGKTNAKIQQKLRITESQRYFNVLSYLFSILHGESLKDIRYLVYYPYDKKITFTSAPELPCSEATWQKSLVGEAGNGLGFRGT